MEATTRIYVNKCRYCLKEVTKGNEYFYIYEPADSGEIAPNKQECESYSVCDSPACTNALLSQKNIINGEELEIIETDSIMDSNDIFVEEQQLENASDVVSWEDCIEVESEDSVEEGEIEFIDLNEMIEPCKYREDIELLSVKQASWKCYGIDPIICQTCEVKFESPIDFIEHTAAKHVTREVKQNNYACTVDFCGQIFISLIELAKHISNEHMHRDLTTIAVKCLHCVKEFETPLSFGKHICQTIFNEEPRKDMICEVCTKVLPSRRRLLFHHQFHSESPRPKICLVCLKKFKYDKKFYNHVMFKHERPKVHFCKKCDRIFDAKKDLMTHKKVHRPRKFMCDHCDAKFLDRPTLNQHMSVHSLTEMYTCEICSKQFSRKYRLSKHVMLIHMKKEDGTVVACDLCDMVFAERDNLLEHYEVMHVLNDDETLTEEFVVPHIYCCQYCEKAYKGTSALLEHLQIHTNEKDPYKCELCQRGYPSYSQLKSHFRLSHTKLGQKRQEYPAQRHYLCHFENCLKSYTIYTSLSSHLKTSHLVKASGAVANKCLCHVCGDEFSNHITLSTHKREKHPNFPALQAEAKLIECMLCNNHFDSLANIKSHQLQDHKTELNHCPICSSEVFVIPGKEHVCYNSSNTSPGPFICDICNKEFAKFKFLTKHKKIVHLRIVNHKCQFCDKGFYNKTDRILHERVHTNEKPLKCDMCDYAGRNHSLLAKHKLTHSDEKRFVCTLEECDKAFKRPSSLAKHKQLHHTGKNFSCDQCPGMYRTMAQLTTHQRQNHNSMKPTRSRQRSRNKPTAVELQFVCENDLEAEDIMDS